MRKGERVREGVREGEGERVREGVRAKLRNDTEPKNPAR